MDHLAKMAEGVAGQSMDDTERGKFDMDLADAALELTQPEFQRTPTSKEGKKLISLGNRYRSLAKETTELFGDLQRPVDVLPVLELSKRLSILAETRNTKRGRQPNDGRLFGFISYLSFAWRLGARRRAGTSTDPTGERRVGRFVEFVSVAAEFLEPEGGWPTRHALGETIRDALQIINKP